MIAFAAFASAVALLIAGHWEPEHCRRGEWWQELWFPGVPILVVVAMATSLLVRPRRPTLLLALPAGVLLVVWFVKFAALAGVCAN